MGVGGHNSSCPRVSIEGPVAFVHKLLLIGMDKTFDCNCSACISVALFFHSHFLHNLILLFLHDFKINMENSTASHLAGSQKGAKISKYCDGTREKKKQTKNAQKFLFRAENFSLVELLWMKSFAVFCCVFAVVVSFSHFPFSVLRSPKENIAGDFEP